MSNENGKVIRIDQLSVLNFIWIYLNFMQKNSNYIFHLSQKLRKIWNKFKIDINKLKYYP